MITSLLIANRGEIACRVIRTARHPELLRLAFAACLDAPITERASFGVFRM